MAQRINSDLLNSIHNKGMFLKSYFENKATENSRMPLVSWCPALKKIGDDRS